MDNNNQDAFQDALAAEFELPPEDTTTTTTAPPAAADDAEVTPPAVVPPVDEATPPAGDAEKTDEEKAAEAEATAEAEKVKNETAEETANRHATEAADKAASEAPQFATKDDVKAAMREYNQETTGRVTEVHTVREDIIKTLYPEGIDQKVYDTEGRVIKDAQEIVDRGLVNDRTGEPYTYEEAASFMLRAGQQMAKNVEELNTYAESVAEENINLKEGNQRVMAEWGGILKVMPKLAAELAEEYVTTQLKFDKTRSYIEKMSMTPEAYYRRALAPYKQLGQALAEKNAAAAQQQAAADEEAKQNQQNEQDERNGIPPQRGTSKVNANTGDPMLDALVDELNKG